MRNKRMGFGKKLVAVTPRAQDYKLASQMLPDKKKKKNHRMKCELPESFCKDFFPITLSSISVTAPERNSRDKIIRLLSDKTVIKHKSFASLSKTCTSLFPQVYAWTLISPPSVVEGESSEGQVLLHSCNQIPFSRSHVSLGAANQRNRLLCI